MAAIGIVGVGIGIGIAIIIIVIIVVVVVVVIINAVISRTNELLSEFGGKMYLPSNGLCRFVVIICGKNRGSRGFYEKDSHIKKIIQNKPFKEGVMCYFFASLLVRFYIQPPFLIKQSMVIHLHIYPICKQIGIADQTQSSSIIGDIDTPLAIYVG